MTCRPVEEVMESYHGDPAAEPYDAQQQQELPVSTPKSPLVYAHISRLKCCYMFTNTHFSHTSKSRALNLNVTMTSPRCVVTCLSRGLVIGFFRWRACKTVCQLCLSGQLYTSMYIHHNFSRVCCLHYHAYVHKFTSQKLL